MPCLCHEGKEQDQGYHQTYYERLTNGQDSDRRDGLLNERTGALQVGDANQGSFLALYLA